MKYLSYMYVSNATALFSSKALGELVNTAVEKNEKHGITGYLYYNGHKFLQYIEGNETNLLALINNLQRDSRHNIIHSIVLPPNPRRIFPTWFMRNLADSIIAMSSYEYQLEHCITSFSQAWASETKTLENICLSNMKIIRAYHNSLL